MFSPTIVALLVLALAGCAGDPGSGAGTTTAAPTPRKSPSIQFTPVDGADGVPPKGAIKAAAANATITEAVLTNASGEKVDGSFSSDRTSWSVGEALGYGKTYTFAVTARGTDGRTITESSEFSTLTPEHTTYVSMNPLDGQTVGVGQPLAFYFSDDAPPPDKKRAEQAITISTDPHVEGAFYWFDDREVHWRPEEYWEPDTTVQVDIDVYGRKLGNDVYGESDRTATITIGDSVVLRADGASHRMSVEVNGEVVRTIPISMGRPSFPSHNGVHVVMRKSPTYLMDSRTYGLPLDEGGYKTEVKWAVRISNGGEFLHAAPWSVADQGERNVSHGCINMSTSDAEWVYDLVGKGDIVEITNSGGEQLPSWDGFGDWQIPWSEWTRGNR